MNTASTATIRNVAGIYLRGLCMGAADAVPGVSGGTIALITGIYERLISAITAVRPSRIKRIARGIHPVHRADGIAALRETDPVFLVALGSGVLTAVVTVLRVVSTLLATNPIETYGFFFGLIGASAAALYSEISLTTRGRKVAASSGFVLAFFLSGYVSATSDSTLPLIFLAGTVAISAMVLPGVSGSLLLLLLGQYEYLSRTIQAFTDAVPGVISGGRAGVVEHGIPIVVFLSGASIGLFTVAHAVQWALKRYRQATIVFLVSLIVGALRAPVEQASLELERVGRTWTPETTALFVGFAIVGAVVVGVLTHMTDGENAVGGL